MEYHARVQGSIQSRRYTVDVMQSNHTMGKRNVLYRLVHLSYTILRMMCVSRRYGVHMQILNVGSGEQTAVQE